MKIVKTIENEMQDYFEGGIEISEGNTFSQYQIVRRIAIYANQIYTTGKIDAQDNYKFWYDIISPRIDTEIKNIDFDTRNIILYSDARIDSVAIFIANAALKEWMRETKQAVELNDAVEEGSAWGNVVWKKTKESYERVDLKNFFVINQAAKILDKSPAIERHILTQTDLRAKKGIWDSDAVESVIKDCANKFYSVTKKGIEKESEIPHYEIFERNGEVSEEELFEAQGKGGGQNDVYLLAKIVLCIGEKGTKKDKHVLFADKIKKMPYKEYHRGRYTGRWWRRGLIEILMDPQTRANQIGNQIAKGLQWASKTIFTSKDRLIVENILTDMQNGDIIQTDDLKQLSVRMQGVDQLIADWNNLMIHSDKLANSYEVARGETMPSGTPFRLAATLNINVNKLFGFIREKLGLALESVFEDWIKPGLMKDLKSKDVLRLTGSNDLLNRYYELVVQGWYIRNLLALGPHTREQAEALKRQKMQEIREKKDILIKLEKDLFKGVKARAKVVIVGESLNLIEELETLATFIKLETDPIRRTALIERAMEKKGYDVASLPKTEPGMLPPTRQQAGGGGGTSEIANLRNLVNQSLET